MPTRLTIKQIESLICTKVSKCKFNDGYCYRVIKGKQWNRLKLPHPQNMEEFHIITQLLFGKKLTLRFDFSVHWHKAHGNGRYQIVEKYDSYHRNMPVKYGSYHLNDLFANHVFGKIWGGGIAVVSYGEFYIENYRQFLRLKKLQEDLHKDKAGRSLARPCFVRLAQRYGLGENTGKGGGNAT